MISELFDPNWHLIGCSRNIKSAAHGGAARLAPLRFALGWFVDAP